MPNPTNPELFSLPEDRINRLEFIPYPAVAYEEHFNTNARLEQQRFSLLVQHVLGAVRTQGYSVELSGSQIILRGGLLFFREFLVYESSTQTLGEYTSGTRNVILKVTRLTKTFESHEDDVRIVSEGRSLSGPNHVTFDVEYMVQTGSPPQGTTNTFYLHLATIENGELTQLVPDRNRLFHVMDEGEFPLTNTENLIEDSITYEINPQTTTGFKTVHEAITYLTQHISVFKNTGKIVRLSWSSNYTMTEPLIVHNQDLSWIEFRGQATIDASGMDYEVEPGIFPIFAGINNSKLPTFNFFKPTVDGTKAGLYSIYLEDNSSLSCREATTTITNPGSVGMYVGRGCKFTHNMQSSQQIRLSIEGASENGLIVNGGYVAAHRLRCRKGQNEDPTDIVIKNGGILLLEDNTAGGGYSFENGDTEVNVVHPHGIIFDPSKDKFADIHSIIEDYEQQWFQSGSNSNGNWTKLGDKLLINHGVVSVTTQSNAKEKQGDFTLPLSSGVTIALSRTQAVGFPVSSSGDSRAQFGTLRPSSITDGVVTIIAYGDGVGWEGWSGDLRITLITILT